MREPIVALLREVPSDTILWKLVDGRQFTAGELADLFEADDPIGNQYATELLRVSRDLISRRAKPSIVDALAPTKDLPALNPIEVKAGPSGHLKLK